MSTLLFIACLLLVLGQAQDLDEQTQLEKTCENPNVEFIALNLPHDNQPNRYIDQICSLEVCGLSKSDHESCAVKNIPILISLAQSEDIELYDANEVHKAYLAPLEDPLVHPYDGLDIAVVDPNSDYLLDFLLEVRKIHPGIYLSLSLDYRKDISILDELKIEAGINRTNLIMTQEESTKFTPEELEEKVQMPPGYSNPAIENANGSQSDTEEQLPTKDWSSVIFYLEALLHVAMLLLLGLK